MALQWDWNKKVGTATLVESRNGEDTSFELNLYQGNAYLIMIYEWTADDGKEKYQMIGFFADKQHAKNCLGLNKKGGHGDNIYNKPGSRITKLRINKAQYRDTKDLVSLFAEAFDDITIELYSEKGES